MWRPIVNNGLNPHQYGDASACARQAGAPRQVPTQGEEAQDLHDATRQIMVHPTPMKMAFVRKEGQAPVEAQAMASRMQLETFREW